LKCTVISDIQLNVNNIHPSFFLFFCPARNIVKVVPNELKANPRQRIVLLCRINIKLTGTEDTNVKWSFNNRPIQRELYSLLNQRAHSFLISKLVIPEMSNNFVGRYKCEYENKKNFFSLFDTAVITMIPEDSLTSDPVCNFVPASNQEMSKYINLKLPFNKYPLTA